MTLAEVEGRILLTKSSDLDDDTRSCVSKLRKFEHAFTAEAIAMMTMDTSASRASDLSYMYRTGDPRSLRPG